MASKAEKARLAELLPAFAGIPYVAHGLRDESGSADDLADFIALHGGRAVTLRARDLIAVAERLKGIEEALMAATAVDTRGLGPSLPGEGESVFDRAEDLLG